MEDLKGREKPRDTESSEHEETAKLDRLVRNGEWTRLGESVEFKSLTVEGRIVTVQRAVKNRRVQLEGHFYSAVKKHPKRAQTIVGKMSYLDQVSEALDLVLEDNIKEEKVPDIRELKKAA